MSPRARRILCWGVHAYTASGVLWALLALEAVIAGRTREAYLWLGVAAAVDSTDGPMARRLDIKRTVPELDGALMDNIVDYLTWTFVPLVLIWRSGWLPDPAWPWIGIAAVGSLYAFAHADAKQTGAGFFRGFPSYWNFVAFYVDVSLRHAGPWAVALLLAALGALSALPVRFVYPNRATRFRAFFLWGGWLSTPFWIAALVSYPELPTWLVGASSVYPALYVILSIYLDWDDRRSRRALALQEPGAGYSADAP